MKKLILLCSFAMLLFVSPNIQADTLGECAWGTACGGGGGLDGVSDITTTGTITGKLFVENIVEGATPTAVSGEILLDGLILFQSDGTLNGITLPLIDVAAPVGFSFCINNTNAFSVWITPNALDKMKIGAAPLAAGVGIKTVTHTVNTCFVSRVFGVVNGWLALGDEAAKWVTQ